LLDGLITFFASHHAIRADKVLSEAGLAARLIPGPKDLSPNCGTAVRFEFGRREEALGVLAENRVEVDSVIEYRPRTDEWEKPRRRLWSRRE
jgi:hypothetical protein